MKVLKYTYDTLNTILKGVENNELAVRLISSRFKMSPFEARILYRKYKDGKLEVIK